MIDETLMWPSGQDDCLPVARRHRADDYLVGSDGPMWRPHRAGTSAWLPLLALAIGAYALIGLLVVPNVEGTTSIFVVQPLIWSAVAVVAFITWWRRIGGPRPDRAVVGLGVLVAFFQISLWMTLGLISGFGASPYSHAMTDLIGNAAFVVTPIVAIEVIRACVIGSAGCRFPTLTVLWTGVLFGILAVPLRTVVTAFEAGSVVPLIGGEVLVSMAMSVLASLLVLGGGPVASITYMVVVASFEWLSPILPATRWIAEAFVATYGPIVGVLVVGGHLTKPASPTIKPEHQPHAVTRLAWIVVTVMIFFVNGLLGIQPTPVVGTSMLPSLETGDLVVTRDVNPADIKVGDVIRYRSGDEYVIHRVVAIWDGGSELQFMTRGDSNKADDPPIGASLVAGKVILDVDNLGWVSIWLRRQLHRLVD